MIHDLVVAESHQLGFTPQWLWSAHLVPTGPVSPRRGPTKSLPRESCPPAPALGGELQEETRAEARARGLCGELGGPTSRGSRGGKEDVAWGWACRVGGTWGAEGAAEIFPWRPHASSQGH